jgi:competence protein ComEC
MILAFAAGCAWLQTFASLPEPAWAALLPLFAWLAWRVPAGGLSRVLWLGLALAAGVFYAGWRAESRLADALPPLWEGRTVQLQGRVLDLPERLANGLRFELAVERVNTPGAVLPSHLQLGWYVAPGAALPLLAGGDCIEFNARLQRPHGSFNPHGFDYEAWLLERGIRATGTVVGGASPAAGCGDALAATISRWRERLRRDLQRELAGAPYAGIVVALAVGDQDAISGPQWSLFRQTGVTHLFSVSGLHITLFSALVFALTRLLWRRLPTLAQRLPAARAGVLMGLLAAAGYTLLAGYGIPAQRTLYMLAGAALAGLLDRQSSPSRLLAAGLLPVVLIDPWAALAPGFWLSFGAVAALLYIDAGRLRRLRGWRAWAQAQWTVTLALTPLLLAWFQEVSLVSPLANALAVPLISLAVVPLVLAAALLPGFGLAQLAHALLAAVLAALQALAALPQPVYHGAAAGPLALLLALAGSALLLLPRGLPARWLGLLLFLPLLFPRLPAPQAGEAWLTLIDVGQGQALLVRTAGHALLYDSGPRYASGEDAGARTVAPYLWSQGINRLDGLILSHADLDHIGGAESLIASHRPGWLLSSVAGLPDELQREAGRAVMRRRPDLRSCLAGQRWSWDGVHFSVLHPPARQYGQAGFKDNERSCVLRVDTAHGAVLVTGDAERLAEMNLAERRQPLAAEVLIAGHHGSNSSSTADFLAAVRPRWVLLSVGHRNRYGHPHAEALVRFRAVGAQVARTDRQGGLQLRLAADAGAPQASRNGQRYWQR